MPLLLGLIFLTSFFNSPATEVRFHISPSAELQALKELTKEMRAHERTVITSRGEYGKNGLVVPIIIYHHIRPLDQAPDELGRRLSVSPESFERQLAFFEKHGYTTITLRHLMDALEQGVALAKKSIILTFDDGYKDIKTYAYPLMKKRGMVGSLFVISGASGSRDYLSWGDIQELNDSGIFEIGSHTRSHPDLTKLSIKRAREEVSLSRQETVQAVGVPIDAFCYPYGRYNQDIVNLVREAGYTIALTTHYGTRHSSDHLFELKRVRLSNEDVGDVLAQKMNLFFQKAPIKKNVKSNK